MLLVVGLGNPGRQYAGNRHNIGFMAVDAIADRHGFSSWETDRKLGSPVAQGSLDGTPVTLLKPWLYMNDSGVVVGAAKQFRKLALNDIVVFHDEVELPPGELRTRTGGGNAGHNGLRSITAHIGNDYRRVRMGIGHPGKNLVYDYALSDFRPDEKLWVRALCDTIAENAELLVASDDEEFQNKVYDDMISKNLISLRPPPSRRSRKS